MSTDSITLQHNMGSSKIYSNPNLWVEDESGNKINGSLEYGQPYYLWCEPYNSSTATQTNIEVAFYVLPPGANLLYSAQPDVTGSASNVLNTGDKIIIGSSSPFIPDPSHGDHQCMVAVVSSFQCPPPDCTPGTQPDRTNPQVGQHNLHFISAGSGDSLTAQSLRYHVNPIDNAKDAYLILEKAPDQDVKAMLELRGMTHDHVGPPDNIYFQWEDNHGQVVQGDRFDLTTTDAQDVTLQVINHEIRPGKQMAMYYLQQYEQGELQGGSTLLITF